MRIIKNKSFLLINSIRLLFRVGVILAITMTSFLVQKQPVHAATNSNITTSALRRPSSFKKISPAKAATKQPTNPTLSWGISIGATSYQYCINTTASCKAPAAWTSTGTSTSVTLDSLTQGKKYYWQVQSSNAAGKTNANGSSSAWWSLTIATTASNPTSVPPTPTPTETSIPPTPTPTPTPTETSIPPTPTPTATSLPPTPTTSVTPVPPTSTPTSTITAVPPTTTPTTVPPTATSTPDGNVFYVSLSGSDTNPGTLAQPFKTIQKGADVAQAGDTVFIRGGTYTDGLITIKNSGTTDAYITFRNYPDESVIIDDTWVSGRTAKVGMIQIFGKSYIRISGLNLINRPPTVYCNHAPYNCIDGDPNKGFSPRMGIYIRATYTESTDANNQPIATVISPADHIIIENNHIEETVSSAIGVWTGSTNITLDGNTIVNGQNDHFNGQTGSDQEVISIAETDGYEVMNNLVTYNGRLDNHGVPFWGLSGAPGITLKGGHYMNMVNQNGKIHNNRIINNPVNGGIYVDAEKTPISNIDVYQNYTYNSADGVVVGSECGGPVINVRIFNNVIHYSGQMGITIAAVASCYDSSFVGDGPKHNVSIYNNTVYGTWKDGGQGIWITSSNIENIQVRNNIVAFIPLSQNDINNSPHTKPDGSTYYALYSGQISQLATDPRSGKPIPANQIFSSNNIVVNSTIYPPSSPNTVIELPGETVINPQFVKSTIGVKTKVELPLVYTENYSDLHLLLSSPAIDIAINVIDNTITPPIVAPEIDFYNVTRPQLSGYDIGAYEFIE